MSEENRTNAPEEELTQEDINSLKKIRMDKLEELKAKGKNPFEITKYDVTASCAEAKAQYEKLEAELKEQAGEDEEKLKELLEANRITVSVAGRVMSRASSSLSQESTTTTLFSSSSQGLTDSTLTS